MSQTENFSLNDLMKNRRTIHHYEPTPVPEEFIDEALSQVIYAPNHHLTYPYRFYRIGETTKKAFLARAFDDFAQKDLDTANKKIGRWSNIPGWLLVTQTISENEKTFLEDHATLSIAMYMMMLSFHKNGVGSKWSTASLFSGPAWYELCDIDPEKEIIRGVLWFGYPEKMPKPNEKPAYTDFVKVIP